MPVISSNKPYRIGRSKTGLGLFATQPIKKGTKIIRYFGPMLDCRKKKDDAIENKYLFAINGRWTIDGSVRKNIARYINHSCRPNAESDVNTRKRTVFIRAIKNIAPGDEINYDYGTDYFKEYLKPIGCKCDSCEKKRAKLRVEARAVKAKDKKKAAKTKSAKPATKGKPAKAKTAGKAATKTSKANASKKSSKAKSAKASKTASAAKSARTSSRRTADYARAASSGARLGPNLGPRAAGAARATPAASKSGGGFGA